MKKRTVEFYKTVNELIQLLDIPENERELDEEQKQYMVATQEEECWRKHPSLPLEISSWGRVYRPAFIDSKNCIREGRLLNLSANQSGVVGITFKRDSKRKRFTVRKLIEETF
ncbi:hypothetical protein HRG49_13230 [Enterococcus faecalis]|jgi:hypothetical protein|uniref:hypothetical protein n=1 Tax=Bacillus TaxID=1386 RepID=UPI000CFDE57E|nr:MULTISPECIES: hypothetical protein [Bacillus]NST54685.1 hypothetical protein [Enterococcus faecalis]PQZ45661.1 hypothetical protein CQZ94_29610 [Bacillus sp. MYb209]RAN67601.1 hypothetical protein B5P40_24355 [Bacillus sp. SRB_8]WJE74219.1 hypothetical protein QRE62_03610 [Bacillus mycoides]